jgi:uncharacterized membrane protein YwaF
MYVLFLPHTIFILIHLLWITQVRNQRSEKPLANSVCAFFMFTYVIYQLGQQVSSFYHYRLKYIQEWPQGLATVMPLISVIISLIMSYHDDE